ncbi:MAG: TIGR00341 family protein [bacterium]
MFLKKLSRGFLLTQELTHEEKEGVFSSVVFLSHATNDYYFFILCSTIIATFGLVTDSAAVIIGAMVVAPLMNPILGIAMGVVRGDLPLINRSFRNLLFGVLVALAISWISVRFLPYLQVTREILARTQPTLYDLIIALAAGAAGAYAIAKAQMFMALPGVAIAVSLMPPLATTGIGLALGNQYIYLGSFLLFITNLVGIHLSGILVFALLGFVSKGAGEGRKNFLKHLRLSILLVILLSLPLGVMMERVYHKNKTESVIRQTINQGIGPLPESELAKLRWHEEKGRIIIVAVVYAPSVPGRELAEGLKKTLEKKLGSPVTFSLEVLPFVLHKIY